MVDKAKKSVIIVLMENYYDILHVSPDATQEQIKQSFVNLARQFHPDVYAGDKAFAERYTAILTEAYEAINDQTKRAKYDKKLGLANQKSVVTAGFSEHNANNQTRKTHMSKWSKLKLFFLLLGLFAIEIVVLFFVIL